MKYFLSVKLISGEELTVNVNSIVAIYPLYDHDGKKKDYCEIVLSSDIKRNYLHLVDCKYEDLLVKLSDMVVHI